MLTKTQIERLNRYQMGWMQWLTVQPFPVVGGAAVGLLLGGMAIAFPQLWQSSQPEPVMPGARVEPPVSSNPPPPAWQVAIDALPGAVSLPSGPAKPHPKAPSPYDQAMAIGYRAYRHQDYHTALINFRRALGHQEGDRYATEAMNNVEAILQQQRQLDQD